VERPTNKSFYINFPAALAEAAEIEKGEDFEWQAEDRNTFVLRRVIKAKSFVAKKKKC
jgi:antitoxin component of MazEF toxin-antitoxin module